MHREVTEARTGERSAETACGVTSLDPEAIAPKRLLELNCGHWRMDASHHIPDWSFDEDRSRIRTGHGPENTTLLRRFATGLVKARGLAVAETMRRPGRDMRRVLDFLKMTGNARPRPGLTAGGVGPRHQHENPARRINQRRASQARRQPWPTGAK